ncbi:MAG: deoxyribodipyrimidine photo-lyase [Actinobacteria bacterium]|nr:MAG: deoxyribodipyrimidine photo-lyase [Actinomycetota bacterium]
MRNDLRLADNPALFTAAGSHRFVAPVVIVSPEGADDWAPGSASRAWQLRSLAALGERIEALGGTLTVLTGPAAEAVVGCAQAIGADAVYWNRRYEPSHVAVDEIVQRRLESAGIAVHVLPGSLLVEPDVLTTQSGGAYKVFTPFFNAALRTAESLPLPAPERILAPPTLPRGVPLAALPPRSGDVPDIDRLWTPGEVGAETTAGRFFSEIVDDYERTRERPDIDGTSRLSPHIAFGEISPRTLKALAEKVVRCNGECHVSEDAAAFTRQLFWRDFAYHLLHHYPHTPELPLRRGFDVFPWSRDPDALNAWREGMTGFPIVDAGMRQMLATGWMHNRVRMLVASLLTKDLLLPWTEGSRWFWERLVDADLANNTFGWQWVAGSGADAAPYFRIFNPVIQGERFDPDGAYVKQWVPELEGMPPGWVHRPWSAPTSVLAAAGVTLGRTYPHPIVDHAAARLRALAVYGSIRNAGR